MGGGDSMDRKITFGSVYEYPEQFNDSQYPYKICGKIMNS